MTLIDGCWLACIAYGYTMEDTYPLGLNGVGGLFLKSSIGRRYMCSLLWRYIK